MKMYIAGPVRRTCPPRPSCRLAFPPPPSHPFSLWATLAVVRRRVSRCAGNPARIEERGEQNRVRVNKTREQGRQGKRERRR